MQRRPISCFRSSTTFDVWIFVESITKPEVADAGVPWVGTSWSPSSRSAGCRTWFDPAVREFAGLDNFVFFFYQFSDGLARELLVHGRCGPQCTSIREGEDRRRMAAADPPCPHWDKGGARQILFLRMPSPTLETNVSQIGRGKCCRNFNWAFFCSLRGPKVPHRDVEHARDFL